MRKKYVLTDDNITVDGRRLYRIKCVRPFILGIVDMQDELGGYVEHEGNLSHDGKAWVAGDAMVMGNAWVEGDALVCDNACVRDAPRISDHAMVCDNAVVSGNAIVGDDAEVKDRAQISGNAHVYDGAWISGDAQVEGDAWINDFVQVSENAIISGNAQLHGDVFIYGTACINGEARVGGNAHIGGDALVSHSNDYLHIDNLYPRFDKYNEYYSVTAFVTVNKTIEVMHTLSLRSLPFPPVTVEEFEAEIEKTYRETDYMMQYQTVISLIKIWSKINRK